jgi:hypothetical protein
VPDPPDAPPVDRWSARVVCVRGRLSPDGRFPPINRAPSGDDLPMQRERWYCASEAQQFPSDSAMEPTGIELVALLLAKSARGRMSAGGIRISRADRADRAAADLAGRLRLP